MDIGGGKVVTRKRIMSNFLLDFANHQEELGIPITPELREVGNKIEERKEAQRRYDNRPLRCRLGLHKRQLSAWGGWYLGTCVICWRELL